MLIFRRKRMSCLLPQFKCLPDTFAVFSKTHHHYVPNFCSKSRDLVSIRTQCLLTAMLSPASVTNSVLDMEKFRLNSVETTSSAISDGTWNIPTSTDMTAVLDVQKLKLTTLDADSNTIAANRPWIYAGAVGPPVEANFKPALATEALVDEEAVIAAAAAEAVALAKAAVEVAKEAALIVARNLNIPDNKAIHAQTRTDMVMFERKRVQWDQLSEKVQTVGEPEVSAIRHAKSDSFSLQFAESDDLETTNEELELLRLQLSSNVAVKSGRQIERKAKRSRAAERAASSIVSVKTGSSSRRKRSSYQEIDYNDPFRYIRGTTSSSRLLTASEEQELSEAIQDLLKLERLHEELEKGSGIKPTFAQWADAAGVDQKTLRRRLNYGIQCKDKMIKSNIRLVISIAKNYQGSGMNIQDLVQEGCRGLVRGAEKFDASKGFKFSTYAHWWIKQAVRKSLSDQSRTIRLPFHMVEATYRVKEARKQLYSEHGRAPNDKEVAAATGLSMKRLSAVLLTPKAPLSLDQKIGFNQNLKPSEVIADPEAGTAEDILTREFMKQDLKKVLDSLNKREKQVIRWRFGLEDGRMKTLQEIGELMGVSRERIRQIELCAFRKLKSKRRTKHLQQYLHS